MDHLDRSKYPARAVQRTGWKITAVAAAVVWIVIAYAPFLNAAGLPGWEGQNLIAEAEPGNPAAVNVDIGQAVAQEPAPSKQVWPADLPLLDEFDRSDAHSLGPRWQQPTALGLAVIQVKAGEAIAINVLGLPSEAVWEQSADGFGANQGTSFIFRNSPVDGTGLILKASGATTLGVPANFIQITYSAKHVIVSTTSHHGGNPKIHGTFPAALQTGDQFMACADPAGKVTVFTIRGKLPTLLGSITIPLNGPSSWQLASARGKIGMRLPPTAAVDDFRGGDVP